MSTATTEARVAPVVWCGWQSGMGVMPDIELWNLTAPIPGHPAGSTLSRQTLERLGYTVPAPARALAGTEAAH